MQMADAPHLDRGMQPIMCPGCTAGRNGRKRTQSTQKGNNNAYCQDNALNWYDWNLNKRKQDFLSFCQHVIRLRQNSELLSRMNLEDDRFYNGYNVAAINCYKPVGTDKASEDW